jgi:pantetheine-phosphate adenylyltransferase, bacterial
MTTAIFPGSFDPLTLGHVDIIERACKCFDNVIVAVGVNPSKKTWFSPDERVDMIKSTLPGIEVVQFTGLLVDLVEELSADLVVKGVRGEADFAAEVVQAAVNMDLSDLQTVFMPTRSELAHISSTVVKELTQFEVDPSGYLPEKSAEYLRRRGKSDARKI